MNLRSPSPGCTIIQGNENNPKMVMTSPGGAAAEVYFHGAHVTSWVPAGGSQKLFLSEKSAFGPNASIRGGIPVIFPQFSDSGPLPKHGFARRMDWQPVLTQITEEDVIAGFTLVDNEETLKIWPHAFSANLSITLSNQALVLKLRIKNTGDAPFSFTSALHTYLKIEDIQKVKINGLYHFPFMDNNQKEKPPMIQTEKSVHFKAEIDRLYPNAPAELKLIEEHSTIKVSSEGFRDTVIWNPWVEKGAKLMDMLPLDYRQMVCIEAAAVQNPISLAPQKSWTGSQTLAIAQVKEKPV
jgi:glucose-6-phosphate 1-epimerase